MIVIGLHEGKWHSKGSEKCTVENYVPGDIAENRDLLWKKRS